MGDAHGIVPKHGIGHGKHRRTRTDTDGESEYCGQRKQRMVTELPQSVLNVLNQIWDQHSFCYASKREKLTAGDGGKIRLGVSFVRIIPMWASTRTTYSRDLWTGHSRPNHFESFESPSSRMLTETSLKLDSARD